VRGFGVESSDSEIYERHRSDLIRYATVLVGRSEAEDVVSAVVLRVLSKRRLADLDEPRSYLFRSVLNEVRSRARRRSEPPSIDPQIATSDWGFGPDVRAAVASLPVRQRSATYLFYWLELSVGETAELMGVRPGTIKRYLKRSRDRLREVLGG